MKHNQFYKVGTVIYPWRWYIMSLWVLLILACIPFLPHAISCFKTTGFIDEKSTSAVTQAYLNKQLGYHKDNKFIIIYTSPTLHTSDPAYFAKIHKSLAKLDNFPLKHDIFLPENNPKQISKDKHSAYVVVMIKKSEPINDQLLARFKAAIKRPAHMSMQIGGELIFNENLSKQTQIDLFRSDFVATPVAIITLLLIFGSLVAAAVPLILGGGCAIMILTILYVLSHFFTLSVFTINIALMLGLCLCLDYSLFIISRFRDELEQKVTIGKAIPNTQGSAGKAVFFSGLAVFVSLSALFLFPINILFSVAMGGLTAVFVAVLTANVFLPALLAILNTRINKFSVRLVRRKKNKKNRSPTWHWIAETVVGRPVFFLVAMLIILLTLAYPATLAKFGVSDYHILPELSSSRQFFDTYAEKFKESELTPISMVVQTNHGNILSRPNIDKLYDLTSDLKDNHLIAEVNSIVTTTPRLTASQYYELYNLHKNQLDPNIKQLLETTTRHYFTVITIVSNYQVNSSKTQKLIKELHTIKPGYGLSARLTGTPVSNVEVMTSISHVLIKAVLWIMISTFFILLILLRSVVLPIKAIVMNLLSLSASYGALVFVFQEGYLHRLLNFEPQGMLDISLLVIIFCALFGFSMDYEVFLLTRIKESYELYKDNHKSIVFGIEKSSRIITSAAIIVICLCGSFLVADVIMVKAFGFGIAIAIFVDAFLIRTILVPAVMALLKDWNWYLPARLGKVLPKI